MTQQPQFACDIDWGNPITRDIALCKAGGIDIDLANKTLPAFVGLSKLPTTAGVGDKYDTSIAGAGAQYGTKQFIKGFPLTIFALTKSSASSFIGAIFSQRYGSGSFEQIDFMLNGNSGVTASSGYLGVYCRTTGGSVVAAAHSIGAVVDGVHTYACTMEVSASGLTMYRDGVPLSVSSSVVTSGAIASANQKTSLGNFADAGASTAYINYCPTHLVLAFNRALSPAEIKSLSANPWQIFRAPNITPWVGI